MMKTQEERYVELVYRAVRELQEYHSSVSRQKIVENVQSACRRGKNVIRLAKLAIIKAVEVGLIIRTSGSGLNGSFIINKKKISPDWDFERTMVQQRRVEPVRILVREAGKEPRKKSDKETHYFLENGTKNFGFILPRAVES
ncbi:predicted protein [Nematostella vectensis]|uniref:H15 domain-containing protein n=1 Tax=Nematostella vectensis TaxID=45351 RepID=A7RVB4_NEMVE|nr:predicted protein [Nematostella vectensis]|eukprot:XP_001636605.1 predicted protein [Nematostella vectensis]